MHRFLPGILLLQLVTLVLFWINLPSSVASETVDSTAFKDLLSDFGFVFRLLLPIVLLGLVTAFWFSSVAKQANVRAVSKLQDGHAKEREKIQIRAERDKTRVVEQTQKEIRKETQRVNRKASIKVGMSMLVAAFAGVILILTELITLGVITLTTAGGALGGYLWRGKSPRHLPVPDNVSTVATSSQPYNSNDGAFDNDLNDPVLLDKNRSGKQVSSGRYQASNSGIPEPGDIPEPKPRRLIGSGRSGGHHTGNNSEN